LLDHHIDAVEAGLLCGLISEPKFTMSSGEIDLELRPCFSGNRSRLPRATIVGKQSRVKYERVCNINDHGGAIRLPACYRKGSGILDLLEKRLDW
jgi:hypothetical protein